MSAAHIAAQAALQEMMEEEEIMTTYTREELDNDWEFKIVRSATDAFKNPQVLQTLLEEEAVAGWWMVEKFSNGRVRFKRPAAARERDARLPAQIDPYRTQYGMSEGAMVSWVLLASFLVIGGIIYLAVRFFG